MLYGGATMASLIACLYLLLRKGNAFAPDVTPPLTLRRWAAAFFAVSCLGHFWWLLLYFYSRHLNMIGVMVASVLDIRPCRHSDYAIRGTMGVAPCLS